ncbi:hypothetical protein [Kitasatospora sp. NPDC004289]
MTDPQQRRPGGDFRHDLRAPTRWTRATGAAAYTAYLGYLVALLLLPWRPGLPPVPLALLGAALLCSLLWLLAAHLAPAADTPPDVPAAPAPATPEDVAAADATVHEAARRRAPWHLAMALLIATAGPALYLPFSGSHPEVAARQAELVAAGAQWGDYVLLPPVKDGERLPDHPHDLPYRFAPVDGTPGGPVSADSSPAIGWVEADVRARLLVAPGHQPLAEAALRKHTAPAPIRRPAVLLWTAAVLLATALIARRLGPGRRWHSTAVADFYAASPQWHRVRFSGTRVVRTLPPEEQRTDGEGEPITTERCIRLDLVGTDGHVLYSGGVPPHGPAWLGIATEPPRSTGDPRSSREAFLLPDRHGRYFGHVRPPRPTPVDAPAPRPRPVRPDPSHSALDLSARRITALLALWPIGWTAYHYLAPAHGTLSLHRAALELLLIPMAAACAALVLALIATPFVLLHLRLFRRD